MIEAIRVSLSLCSIKNYVQIIVQRQNSDLIAMCRKLSIGRFYMQLLQLTGCINNAYSEHGIGVGYLNQIYPSLYCNYFVAFSAKFYTLQVIALSFLF